ncbi:MAG: pantoate--beta-alanine ligase [Bryobacteraceae bacterium]
MTLEWFAAIPEARRRLAEVRENARTIGLVPTMGALHGGHGALIEHARRETDCVVVSIFVNPIQFDRPEDYEAYQVNLERDRDFCETRGVDIIFAPAPSAVYAPQHNTFVEVMRLPDHLCGKFRPGHFRGVATVVAKLLNIVAPDKAYFGEKDVQQLAIIQRMVADLNIPVEIVPVATVREPDGLASSSRNQRLSPEERRIAPALFEALDAARSRVAAGCVEVSEIRQAALLRLQKEPQIRVEYLEVVDPLTMAPVENVAGPVRIAAAVWLGATRLIDNVYCA